MAVISALLGVLSSTAAAAASNITVSPTVVPTELRTRLWVTVPASFGDAARAAAGRGDAICSIESLDNTFVGYQYRAVGDYNCLKRVPATVYNSTHLSCSTVRLHNSAPATVRASLDNGTTWLPGEPRIDITPLVEVAVGRRPYTSERGGQLVVKVAGEPLLAPGSTIEIVASLPTSVHRPALVSGIAASGRTSLLNFPLQALPSKVFADLTIIATIPGYGTVEYTRNFQRAPPPANRNVTIVAVDHATRGMLLGRGGPEPEPPWLPFLAVGWFNSAFTYAMEGTADSSLAPAPQDASPLLINGADRVKEWGRKGINLVRMGWRSPPELMLAELDHMHATGVYAMISVPTPGHCNETAKPGKPARNCTADYEHMLGNMTVVKDHPATWGYYICACSVSLCLASTACTHNAVLTAPWLCFTCSSSVVHAHVGDDCCAGYEYLKELAVVYRMMKAIDPYHLTAGALECGEMHAFQEPQLSLDAPMRENYRPDLTFHANDGTVRGGSDGILRMPPLTFEPIINMADAVRQPRPFLAQTAAWLGVITADMPMQNWYVYNRIMYMRWMLEDSTAALNAQILELTPSLLGSVTTVHPVVTVLEGDDWIRARAWRDVSFEAQRPGNLCVHLVVASVGVKPGNFEIRLDGVCAGDGSDAQDTDDQKLLLPACPKIGLNATHLFNQYYAVPTIGKQGTHSLFVNDVLTPGSTSVYALGCDSWTLGDGTEFGAKNLVNDGGFEDTELPLTPGFITCAEEAQYPANTFKGQCKLEDKHAGSWVRTSDP